MATLKKVSVALTLILLFSFLAACSANPKAEDNSQLSSIENNHEEDSLSFMDLVERHLPDNVERTEAISSSLESILVLLSTEFSMRRRK